MGRIAHALGSGGLRTLGFTMRSRCLLAAGFSALVCGFALGEPDLLRAGILIIAVPIVASVVVRRSQVSIASRRHVDPLHIPAGSAATMTLAVSNRSVLPTGPLMMEDRLPSQLVGRARFVLDGLAGRGSRSVTYRIPGLNRGTYTAGPLRLRLTDPFGLVDVTRSFTATSTFTVRPVVEPLPGHALPRSWDAGENAGSHSIGTHGADDASTREYRRGDDLRKIHWRSTARAGQLMVRHEERPWQGHTSLLLDNRALAHRHGEFDDDDPRMRNSLEWAISCIASIGSHLLANGREVSLIAETSSARHTSSGASRFLDELAVVTSMSAPDLSPTAEPLRRVGRESTLLAVLGTLDSVSLRLLTDAHPRGAASPAFAIVLDVDSWSNGVRTTAGSPASFGSASWRPQAEVLRSSGWMVAPARRTDTAAAVWSALLGQRPSGSVTTAAATVPVSAFDELR
ncbi:MAG: DUF58 domain-containing protein [Actinobacteria bacterium]|nr:DUF58 domain-containing protein [Actinomycetota bacterium]